MCLLSVLVCVYTCSLLASFNFTKTNQLTPSPAILVPLTLFSRCTVICFVTDCVVFNFLHGHRPFLQLRTDEMNGKVKGEDEEEEHLDEEEDDEEEEDEEDEEEHPEEEEEGEKSDEKVDILDEKRKETEEQEQSITEPDIQVPWIPSFIPFRLIMHEHNDLASHQ